MTGYRSSPQAQTKRVLESDHGLGKIAAAIVTWNPPRELERNIETLLAEVSEIYLLDNGSSANTDLLERLAADPRICVVRNPDNAGVATALNQAIMKAATREADWLLLLDQDSCVAPGFAQGAERALNGYERRSDVAIIAPVLKDRVSGEIETGDFSNHEDRLLHWAITSGSLANVKNALHIGPFMEAFFSDYVDHEYCLRARARGYVILQAPDAMLHHSVGRPTLHSLLWRPCRTTNHEPWRRYYMARNRVWLYRRYLGQFPRWVSRDLSAFAKEIVKIACFEQHAGKKLQATVCGIRDALMGRPPPPPAPLSAALAGPTRRAA